MKIRTSTVSSELNQFVFDSVFSHSKSSMPCFIEWLEPVIIPGIINHSLLASCFDKKDSIIDNHNICIIDEAHKLSENCRMYLKESLNKNIFQGLFESYSFIVSKILNNNKENRAFGVIYDSNQNIIKEFSIFLKLFQDLSYSFADLKLKNSTSYTNIQDIRYKCTKIEKIDLNITLKKIMDMEKIIKKIFSDDSNYVNWISIISNNNNITSITFNIAPLWVHDIFTDLSMKFDSMILTSATLTVDESFDYILQEVGLNQYSIDKKIVTEKFCSPFSISDQIKLFVNDSNHNINSIDFIESIISIF